MLEDTFQKIFYRFTSCVCLVLHMSFSLASFSSSSSFASRIQVFVLVILDDSIGSCLSSISISMIVSFPLDSRVASYSHVRQMKRYTQSWVSVGLALTQLDDTEVNDGVSHATFPQDWRQGEIDLLLRLRCEAMPRPMDKTLVVEREREKCDTRCDSFLIKVSQVTCQLTEISCSFLLACSSVIKGITNRMSLLLHLLRHPHSTHVGLASLPISSLLLAPFALMSVKQLICCEIKKNSSHWRLDDLEAWVKEKHSSSKYTKLRPSN